MYNSNDMFRELGVSTHLEEDDAIATLLECLKKNDLKGAREYLQKNKNHLDHRQNILLLCIAIENNNAEMVACFLEHGMNCTPIKILPNHYDPLLCVIELGNSKILGIIAEKNPAAISLRKAESKNLIHAVLESVCSSENKQEMMKILLIAGSLIADNSKWQDLPKEEGMPDLSFITDNLSKMGLKLFNIGKGPEMNAMILLRFAEDLLMVSKGDSKLRQEKFDFCLKELSNAVNGRDIRGMSALHYEIIHKNRRNVLKLLVFGANIDLPTLSGTTPYDMAIGLKDPFFRGLFISLEFEQRIRKLQALDEIEQDILLGPIQHISNMSSEKPKRLESIEIPESPKNTESPEKIEAVLEEAAARVHMGTDYYQYFDDMAQILTEIKLKEEMDILKPPLIKISMRALDFLTEYLKRDLQRRIEDIINPQIKNQSSAQKPNSRKRDRSKGYAYNNRLGSTLLCWFESDDLKYREFAAILKEAREQCPEFNINDDFEIINGEQYSSGSLNYCFMQPVRKSRELDQQSSYSLKLHTGHLLCAAVGLREFKIVQLLLENKADPNHLSGTPYSPLYGAVVNNDLEMANLLLKSGARIEIEHLLAAKRRMKPMLNALMETKQAFDTGWPTTRRTTLLFYAIMQQDIELLEKLATYPGFDLSEIGKNHPFPPLHWLAAHSNWNGEPLFIEKLLQLGMSLHTTNNHGQTALMVSARREAGTPKMKILCQLMLQECRQFLTRQHLGNGQKLMLPDLFHEFLNEILDLLIQKKVKFILSQEKNRTSHSIWLPMEAFGSIMPLERLTRLKAIKPIFTGNSNFGTVRSSKVAHDKNWMISDLPKALFKIYGKWMIERKKSNSGIKLLLEALWLEMPIKRHYKQPRLEKNSTDNGLIDQCQRMLLNLPKQMMELTVLSTLSEIYKLSGEVREKLAKSKKLNKIPFLDARKDKRRQKRLVAIDRMRYGVRAGSGMPTEEGLYSLVSQAVLHYKNTLELQRLFFGLFSGNPHAANNGSNGKNATLMLHDLLAKKPEKHNKTSYLYIDFLLRAGSGSQDLGHALIKKAYVVLKRFDSIKDRALNQQAQITKIRDTLQKKLQICNDDLEDDYKFDKNPKVSQGPIAVAKRPSPPHKKPTVEKPTVEKAVEPTLKPVEPALKPKVLNSSGSGEVVILFSIEKDSKKHDKPLLKQNANGSAKAQPTTVQAGHIKTPTLTNAPKANGENKACNEDAGKGTQKESNIQMRAAFKSNRSFIRQCQSAGKTMGESQAKLAHMMQQWELERSKRPKPINIAMDWQLESRVQMCDQQNFLRYILETDTKQSKEVNYLIIENNALLISLALMMEQAKRLKGNNQAFQSEMARQFRNAILHGHSILPDLKNDPKKLYERNTRLREMTSKMLDWMQDSKNAKRTGAEEQSTILREINCELLNDFCNLKIEEPSLDECLMVLKLCSLAREIYAKENDSVDPNLLKLAQQYTTAQASTYYQAIVRNRFAWQKQLDADTFLSLKLEFEKDVPEGQMIRHAVTR